MSRERSEIHVRPLEANELKLVWSIDRSELITGIYHLEGADLVLEDLEFHMKGWPPDEEETYHPVLLDCLSAGGKAWGVFDEGRLAGVAVLESRLMGVSKDTLQLLFLHVSWGYRGRGLGRNLFVMSAEAAVRAGAKYMYISATPTENTIRFYLNRGCKIAEEPDPELFKKEPEDIHFRYALGARIDEV